MTSEEYGYILYNGCYGGYTVSNQAHKALKKGMTKEEYESFHRYDRSQWSRSHPKLIELFNEKGWEWVSGSCAKLRVFQYPLKYKNFITIKEYDGLESCNIDFARAYNDVIEQFLKRHDEHPELTVADLKKEITEFKLDKEKYSAQTYDDDDDD